MNQEHFEDLEFCNGWNHHLLAVLNTSDGKDSTDVLRSCSQFHYNVLQMDEILKPFISDLTGFINFLNQKWGWIVTVDESTKTILADENKPDCVCPIVRCNNGSKTSPILCHCSEGFAKMMFRTVLGHEVFATVLHSVLRGDSSCVYEIKY